MRQWIRATRERRCGACGLPIPYGAPMLEITMHRVRALLRCPACAHEAMPAIAPLADATSTYADEHAAAHGMMQIGTAIDRATWLPYRDSE